MGLCSVLAVLFTCRGTVHSGCPSQWDGKIPARCIILSILIRLVCYAVYVDIGKPVVQMGGVDFSCCVCLALG